MSTLDECHLLRRAAGCIEHDIAFGSYWGSDAFGSAVADWFNAMADRYDAVLDTFAPGSKAGEVTAAENVTAWPQAVAAARASLELTRGAVRS